MRATPDPIRPAESGLRTEPNVGIDPGPLTGRRDLFRLAGGTVAGAGLLAACSAPAEDPAPEPSTAESGQAGTSVPTADVPVGGGVIIAGAAVVTQPADGEYLAFSPICTHQGCEVTQVSDGEILCPCHQSTFSIADGSVTGGPAEAPLPALEATVEGDQVIVST